MPPPRQKPNRFIVANGEVERTDQATRLARLERRVARERAARIDAEAIAEQGLRKLYILNRDLDRRVLERVAESERLAREAERAERVKGEFLANLSHELRTPLTAVLGALDVLQAGAETDEYLTAAISGAERLRELLDELFEIVDLESGSSRIARSVIDVRSFVEDLGQRWRIPALKAGLLFVTSVGPTVNLGIELDAGRTQRALERLIDNAIKYSQSGTITLGFEHGDRDVTFYIRDEGPGIEPDRLDRLVEAFELGDRSSTRIHQGVGLGLTLARGIVEMMDGRITIDSQIGIGTTVTVILPARVLGTAGQNLTESCLERAILPTDR